MICSNCRREIANESNFCYLCGARQQPVNYAAAPRPLKRLHRSVRDCKIAGVCGGLAEYWDMDPTVVRVVWAVLTLFPPPMVIAYIVAWIVMPKEELPVYVPVAAQSPAIQTPAS
jgi:phage shock protein C